MVSYELFHRTVFVLLYAVGFLSTFVFFERLIYLYFSAPAEIKLMLKEVEENRKEAESRYYQFSAKLSRGMGILSFCITSSPLLGLLGTVIGIIESFRVMAEKGISDIHQVSKGIGTALEATALGIVIAVISLLYYTLVNGRVSSLKTYMKSKLSEVVLESEKLS